MRRIDTHDPLAITATGRLIGINGTCKVGTTVRLAGRCYTALIAISSLTAVGRGDELQPLMTVPKAQPATSAQAPIAPKRARPKLTPPDEIPGTWVSDDAVKAAQAKAAVQRAYLPPLPITA